MRLAQTAFATSVTCLTLACATTTVSTTLYAPPAFALNEDKVSGAVRIGSKKFTESVLLAEIATGAMQADGIPTVHRSELGGTRILWSALLQGEIDVYPEYTGTLRHEILSGRTDGTENSLRSALSAVGVGMSAPLGFDNGYAIGMGRDRAEQLKITAISQLANRPDIRLGFTNEFMDRADGWPGLSKRYRLDPHGVRGLDHDIAYRALVSGDLDAIDVYATDAEIAGYDLVTLEDDLNHFSEYRAVFLFRENLARARPAAVAVLESLAGTIDAERMTAMNANAEFDHVSAVVVADAFLAKRIGIENATRTPVTVRARLWRNTKEHLRLVGVSLAAAIAIAVPLGVAAARRPAVARVALGVVSVIQTVPALALLVFMIPLLGIGTEPALAALFLYSLLPILRNTYTGLTDIRPELLEAADALGLSARTKLFKIELPLSARAIVAGIKTSAVINIGTATLGALIGAGGYGQPILTGIRLDDTYLILQGAIPAALLAVSAEMLFGFSERFVVPRGLRLPQAECAADANPQS